MVDKGVAAITGELPRGPKGCLRLAYDVKPHQRGAGTKWRQTAEGGGGAAVDTGGAVTPADFARSTPEQAWEARMYNTVHGNRGSTQKRQRRR